MLINCSFLLFIKLNESIFYFRYIFLFFLFSSHIKLAFPFSEEIHYKIKIINVHWYYLNEKYSMYCCALSSLFINHRINIFLKLVSPLLDQLEYLNHLLHRDF